MGPSRAGTPPTQMWTRTTPTVLLCLCHSSKRFRVERFIARLNVSLQSALSCGGRSADTQTQSGIWSTARPITASSPARLMEQSDFGVLPTSHHLWQFLTRTEVRKHLDPEPKCLFLSQNLLQQQKLCIPLSFLALITLLCGSGSDLGVPTSLDLVSCEPAYMVTSFNSGHIGLFNMETQQLLLKLDSSGPPGMFGTLG